MPNKPAKFWDFSLDLYNRERVAEVCLDLQFKYQLDVNLIFLCLWHGSHYGEIEDRLWRDILAFSDRWRRHVVQPLRDTRSWMKKQTEQDDHYDALRERIKADELAAEKYQQETIAKMVYEFGMPKNPNAGAAACTKNIDCLLNAMGLPRDQQIDAGIKILLGSLGQGIGITS